MTLIRQHNRSAKPENHRIVRSDFAMSHYVPHVEDISAISMAYSDLP